MSVQPSAGGPLFILLRFVLDSFDRLCFTHRVWPVWRWIVIHWL